jgi:hypothetical protein
MNKFWRYIRLFFTPGVCITHQLKRVPINLDGMRSRITECPDCFKNAVMGHFRRSGIPLSAAIPERAATFENQISGLRIPVN